MVQPPDDLSTAERKTLDLATELQRTGNLHPLIARLRGGEAGPEDARDALLVLGELDPQLLVQVALDALIAAYLDDPGAAYQPNREAGRASNAR